MNLDRPTCLRKQLKRAMVKSAPVDSKHRVVMNAVVRNKLLEKHGTLSTAKV